MDISRHDTGSAERERKRNVEDLKPAEPPNTPGGFDIRPSHVYYASGLVSNQQFEFHKSATGLLGSVGGWSQTQVAGRGHGADAFADAYKKVAKRYLEVWARAILSIEGVVVGLTETANNYQRADWNSRQANRHHQLEMPPLQSPPVCVGKVTYESVSSIKWTGTGDHSGPLLAWAGDGPDWLADTFKEAFEHGLRLGKTVEITPGADTGQLRAIGDAWQVSGKSAKQSAKSFSDCIAYITNSGNSEWQGAMNAFCQSIWGTTAWGRSRDSDNQDVARDTPGSRDWKTKGSEAANARRPIIEVLAKTANELHQAFHDAADAADKARETTSRLGAEAAKATIKDLTTGLDLAELTRLTATLAFGEIVMTFRSHMDKSGADAAVEACHKAFHEASAKVDKLMAELDEAFLSAPTFAAGEARARSFGARALDEFKPRHRWTKDGHTDLGIYQIDLASTEWLENSHTATRHVGLTDEQLAQRLRDDLKKGPRPVIEGQPPPAWPHGQPFPANASTFKDLDTAQRVTQYNIDEHADEIKNWIERQQSGSKREPLELPLDSTPYGTTGRSIDRQHMRDDPFPANKAEDTYGVKTKLVFNEDLDPPFVVMTSMPVVGDKES
ncbi:MULTISPECIES: RNase A-like domain-containing protein [unclassified Streptomyces]|uniref:RNase A-like domain-containing protein n=1 Tax=unclassified Streptomyces TaxID=2593676 RepID=UPI0028C4BC29|nr:MULTISPECIES: RNase A-like domain-containing protein [unclassified Streptomyces]WNO72853.1 RNase A-like domain-containing protein [Streptomyces sp. AM8-1-1]